MINAEPKQSVGSFLEKPAVVDHENGGKVGMNENNNDLRKCTKSPTFGKELLKSGAEENDNHDNTRTEIGPKTTSLSPKSKREIRRLFSLPRSVKKRRIQQFQQQVLFVWEGVWGKSLRKLIRKRERIHCHNKV